MNPHRRKSLPARMDATRSTSGSAPSNHPAGRMDFPFQVNRVAVVYCTSKVAAAGRENEKKADCDVISIAQSIKSALEDRGIQVDVVDLDPARIADLKSFDWVFNLSESIFGYPLAEYEIAEQLEKNGIFFTGSGSQTLRACLDKAITKCELLRNGISTPPFEVLQPGIPIFNWLEFPLIVKPIHEDGSIGITAESVVRNTQELETQVSRIHRMYDQPALVESFIDGRDITAAVIGNGEEAAVLPLSEIIYPDWAGPRFLTFDLNWQPDSLDYQVSMAKCPCQLEPDIEILIKDLALRAFQVMGCQDYARVDFRLQEKIPYVLEVNPNPCISPEDSSFTRSNQVSGLSYSEMICKILDISMQGRLKMAEMFNEEVDLCKWNSK